MICKLIQSSKLLFAAVVLSGPNGVITTEILTRRVGRAHDCGYGVHTGVVYVDVASGCCGEGATEPEGKAFNLPICVYGYEPSMCNWEETPRETKKIVEGLHIPPTLLNFVSPQPSCK